MPVTPLLTRGRALPPPQSRRFNSQQLFDADDRSAVVVAAADGCGAGADPREADLLWHNHFATSAAEGRRAAEWMAAQNQKLRTLKLGDFRTLAYAMLTDARCCTGSTACATAQGGTERKPVREFMELFTLGHANGYTEADVQRGRPRAHRLVHRIPADKTDISGEPTTTARTRPSWASPATSTRSDFCDIVLNQPTSARFVASKLWRMLASDDAPSAGDARPSGRSRTARAATSGR